MLVLSHIFRPMARVFANVIPAGQTVLTAQQVCQRLTVSEATLRRYAKAGGDFPRKIKLGPRRVGYLKSDVEAWLARRFEAAGSAKLAS